MALPLAFGVLFIEFILYTLLAIWLTEVLPDSNGVRQAPWFFLLPSFWHPSRYRSSQVHRSQVAGAPVPQRIDEDVAAEAATMQRRLDEGHGCADGSGEGAAVAVYGLQRRFTGKLGGNAFWALTGSWFEIQNRQLFCLLGPNGAGSRCTCSVACDACGA